VLRRCVWSRNIKNRCSIYIYIYDISSLRVNIPCTDLFSIRVKNLENTDRIPSVSFSKVWLSLHILCSHETSNFSPALFGGLVLSRSSETLKIWAEFSSTRFYVNHVYHFRFLWNIFAAAWRVDIMYWIFSILVRAGNYGHKFVYVPGVKYYCYCSSFHETHALISFCKALLYRISWKFDTFSRLYQATDGQGYHIRSLSLSVLLRKNAQNDQMHF